MLMCGTWHILAWRVLNLRNSGWGIGFLLRAEAHCRVHQEVHTKNNLILLLFSHQEKYLVPLFGKLGTGIIKLYFVGITNYKLHTCVIKAEMMKEGWKQANDRCVKMKKSRIWFGKKEKELEKNRKEIEEERLKVIFKCFKNCYLLLM